MTTTAAKFWDDIAEKYAAKPVDDLPAFERKKAITREHLQPTAAVLEVGCGTGSLALELAPLAGHIHALDVSAEMIRIANQKKAAAGVTNITFTHGTLDDQKYAPASFDCVWAYSLLHLVPDRARVLSSLFALLKPGGTLISSNVCLGESRIPYGPVIKLMHWLGKAPAVYIYDRETIMRDLRDAGFRNPREHDVGAGKTIAFIVAEKPST